MYRYLKRGIGTALIVSIPFFDLSSFIKYVLIIGALSNEQPVQNNANNHQGEHHNREDIRTPNNGAPNDIEIEENPIETQQALQVC